MATVGTAGAVLGAAGALDVPGTGMLDEVGEATDAGRTVAKVEGEVADALGAYGKGVGIANKYIKGSLNAAEQTRIIAAIEAKYGKRIKINYGQALNGWTPNGELNLVFKDGQDIPRGVFFEELQHWEDGINGLNPRVIPAQGSLENAQFHLQVFNRMSDNPLFNITDDEAAELYNATLREIRKLRGTP